MRSILFCVLLLCKLSFGIAQSPGGISANNTLWLRSDIGITSSSNIISKWEEISGANVTGNFSVQLLNGSATIQSGPLFLASGINFNPYVRFNGINNSLASLNIFPGTSLVNNSNVSVFQVFNLKSGIVWMKWETDQVGLTGRLGFESAGGKIRFDFPKAVPASAGQNVGVTTVLNKHSLSTAFADATTSVNRLNGATENTLALPGPGDFSAANDKIVIGNENFLNLPAEVDIAELIIYSSTLSANQRNKIESYLAVKYGFTLDQALVNGNNYTASNGVVFWNRAANSGYANDITGIGRDDASALSQKQSRSINSTALVSLYNYSYFPGTIPLLNSANPNSFSQNLTFVLVGDNGASTTLDKCILDGKGIAMKRVWKVQKTGLAPMVTVALDQASVAPLVKNIIISQDPTFPEAASTVYSLPSDNNGRIYRAVPLNNNDYFTFGSDPLFFSGTTITEPTCGNPNNGTIALVASGGIPPFAYLWTPSGQTTQNLSNLAAGSYTVTVTQAGCQYNYTITLQAPPATTPPAANDVSVCAGTSGTLTLSGPVSGYIYNWYSAASGGAILGTGYTFTTPPLSAPATYYVQAVNSGCTSPRIAVNVTLSGIPAPLVSNLSACGGTSAIISIQNSNAAYSYAWFTSASSGIPVGTGTSFTTPVLTESTTFYVEARTGTCSSLRTPVTVNIDDPATPAANGVFACPGDAAQLSIVNPDPTRTYTWYSQPSSAAVLATGASFTTPAITGNIDFYIQSSDGLCRSEFVSVAVNLLSLTDTPVVRATVISDGSITFGWQPVPGAATYQVSIDGGPYSIPSGGPSALAHTIDHLSHGQTVSIAVIAFGGSQSCGKSQPGHATATTYGDGFYVPSAFSPNNDLQNDILRPILPGGSSLEYFTIFNRWGQKVFTTNATGEGWDGRLLGQTEPVGTYVWICRYYARNRKMSEEHGTFSLLH